MTTTSNQPSATESNGVSLYSKIINKEGILGLLVFMFATFLMTIIYQGQQAQESRDEEQRLLLLGIKDEESIQTQILEDIRYSLRSNGGLVFRNSDR